MYIYKPVVSSLDLSQIRFLSGKLNISLLLAQLLWQRGITDETVAAAFLSPDLSHLHDPYALPDMGAAVQCIKAAVERGRRIAIYGDYDVDGITASVVMFQALKALGAETLIYLPDRFAEGYGLNSDAIYKLYSQDVNLIITVDCGITAIEEVNLAHQLGMQVVITDHHQCADEIPHAEAVVDPKRRDSSYPFPSLAGVGIAFKLACALVGLDVAMEYIDMAALGTIADIVPLLSENRVIVKYGLQHMKNNARIGIKALWQAAGLKGDISCINTENVTFQLVPRLNAAGRMSSAVKGLKLLMSQDTDEAMILAKQLDADNRQRQNIERQILQEAVDMINNTIDLRHERAIVLAKEGWHKGVIGIAAGKLAEMYHRPVLIISLTDGQGHGSGRSIPALDLYQALDSCKKYFSAFGGHAQAVGFSISEEYVSVLRQQFNAVLSQILLPKDMVPAISYDARIYIKDISPDLLNELSLLEPFGYGNQQPVFLIGDAVFKDMREVGADKSHLKLCLTSDGVDLDCIAFRNGHKYQELCKCRNIDVVGTLETDQWNDMERIQFKAIHIKPSISAQTLDGLIGQYYDNISDGFINDIIATSSIKSIDSIAYHKISVSERDQWLFQHLRNSMYNLILINTPGQLQHLLYALKEQDMLELFDIHYNAADDRAGVCNRILINAELANLNLKAFSHIILYDVPFSVNYISRLADMLSDQELYILFGPDQLKDAAMALEQWALSRRDMEHLYRALRFAARKSMQYTIKASLLMETVHLPSHKIYKALGIFQRLSLLKYSFLPDGLIYICMMPNHGKIDLTSDMVYNAMEHMQKAFKDLERYVKMKYKH